MTTKQERREREREREREPPCKRLRLAGDEVADEEGADDHESEGNVCDLLAGGGAAPTDNNKQ